MLKLLFLSAALLLFFVTLPLSGKLRGRVYRVVRGYDIHQEGFIGICFLNCGHIQIEAGGRIGHMTCIRNLSSLVVRNNSKIGSFNWIFGGFKVGSGLATDAERQSALTLDPESSVTSRHIIDCSAPVHIGSYSTLAGYRSQILTHGIDIANSRQHALPVYIGKYCMIGSGCLILKGSFIPDGSVLAAGSTFYGRPARGYCLFSGVPARRVKDLDPESEYFRRISGPVL